MDASEGHRRNNEVYSVFVDRKLLEGKTYVRMLLTLKVL